MPQLPPLPNHLPKPLATDVKKVLILGAECTGKSTLASDLANEFHTSFVKEYMRTYLEQKPQGYICQYDDLLPIAIGQIDSENKQLAHANDYLFCDAGLLQLMVYADFYYHDCPEQIVYHALHYRYDVVLLTDNRGVAWVADGMRDLPNGHDVIYQKLKSVLNQYDIKFHTITEDRVQRIAQVKKILMGD